MRLRRLAGPLVAAAVVAVVLAAACGGDSLPQGEFPYDGGLGSCGEGSAAIPINTADCPAAGCSGTAYAICTGVTFGACSCTGGSPYPDTGVKEEPFPTGSEGGAPDVGQSEGGPVETGPEETGPTDTGAKDTGPKDSGMKEKDSGPKDTGPKDTGAGDTTAPG